MAKKKIKKNKQGPENFVTKYLEKPVFWKSNLIPAACLFLLTLGLYGYTLTFDYVLDDQIVLTENSFTKKGINGIWDILSKESFVGRFGEQKNLVTGARYRPLSIVSFALEYEFFGLNPIISHLINVFLYALLALLIFRISSLFFTQSKDSKWYATIPFLVTLVFIVHPIHTEVVANIKGRDEIMSLTGAMLALLFAFKYVENKKLLNLVFIGILFFLALLSKENALTFLAIIPLSIWFFTKNPLKSIASVLIPLLASTLIYLIIRYQVIGYFLNANEAPITDIMNNPFYGLNTQEKFATIFYTLGLYLKLLFFPHPLTHDYYPYQIPIMNWTNWQSLSALGTYILLFAGTIMGLQKKSVIAFGIAFYLITLSIVSNIPFTVGTFMNERFLFMPSFGFCIILVWGLSKKLPQFFSSGRKVKLTGLALLSIFIIGFTAKTIDRIPDWKNRMTLNISGATASPNSARANCFLGTAIFEEEYKTATDPSQKQNLIKEVAYFIDRALEIHPNYGSALIMQSGVVAEEYKYDRDLNKLLNEFYNILTKKSNIPFIGEYLNYLSNGRGNPQQLSDFAYKTGYLFFWQNRQDANNAIKYLNYGLQADPENRTLNQSLGNIYQLIGQGEKAASYLSKVQ